MADKSQILKELKNHQNTKLRIAFNGLRLSIDGSINFYTSKEALIEAVEAHDFSNIYKAEIKFSDYQFLSIHVVIQHLKTNEIGKPLRLVQLARNINGFDSDYARSDDHRVWQFWTNIEKIITKKINNLTPNQAIILNGLIAKEENKIAL